MSTTIIDADSKSTIYTGLSTDSKPTPVFTYSGELRISIFYETDTKDIYRHDGSSWSMVESSGRKMVSDPYVDIIRGSTPNYTLVNKFGAMTTSGTHTTWKPITSSESWFAPLLAYALEAVSDDNTNDVAGGAGIRAIRIYGIKTPTSTTEETEDVNLNGTTAVSLANSWWRIYRVVAIESGTYGGVGSYSHNSTITVREIATPANVWASITSDSTFGFSQSEISCYSIPTGKTAVILNYRVEISNSNGSVNVILAVRENSDDFIAPFEPIQVKAIHKNLSAGETITNDPDAPVHFVTGPADIFMMSRNGSNQTYDLISRMQILVIN